jgi:ankyrin repeat protein
MLHNHIEEKLNTSKTDLNLIPEFRTIFWDNLKTTTYFGGLYAGTIPFGVGYALGFPFGIATSTGKIAAAGPTLAGGIVGATIFSLPFTLAAYETRKFQKISHIHHGQKLLESTFFTDLFQKDIIQAICDQDDQRSLFSIRSYESRILIHSLKSESEPPYMKWTKLNEYMMAKSSSGAYINNGKKLFNTILEVIKKIEHTASQDNRLTKAVYEEDLVAIRQYLDANALLHHYRNKSHIAQVNKPLRNGSTLLHFAALHNKKKVVSELLERKDIDINLKCNGSTPLIEALKHVNKETNDSSICDKILNKKEIDVRKKREVDHATPLHIAVIQKNKRIVERLLEHKNVYVNALMGGRGKGTPIAIAAQDSKDLPILKRLLDQPRIKVDLVQMGYSTPLCIAAENGNLGGVRALLEKDANVNAGSYNGRTPLTIAICKNHIDIVNLLLGTDKYTKIDLMFALSIAKNIKIKKTIQSKLLENYITKITSHDKDHYKHSVTLFGRKFTGRGHSAGEKLKAAKNLQAYIKGGAKAQIQEQNLGALSNGELGELFEKFVYRR